MTNEASFPALTKILRAQEAQRSAENDRIRTELAKGTLPTDRSLVKALIWRVDRPVLMRSHIYWQEAKLRSGLDALISSALLAHLDLTRAEAALTAFAQADESFDAHIKHTVENPAEKEVLAFCASYVGTVDTLRRLVKRRSDITSEIESLHQSHFGSVEFRFIFELRRNLSHGSVVVPFWNVKTDEKGTSGTIHFSSAELLQFGQWGNEARRFLADQREDSFSISAITAFCANGLAKFRRDLGILFARHRTLAEFDYHAVNDLGRRTSGSQFNKIILKRVIEKSVNPYAHLHRFFSPDETRRILEYAPHTAEQVEYIIRLREASSLADEETRYLLCKLFGVSGAAEPAPRPPSLVPPDDFDWPPMGFKLVEKAGEEKLV